MKKSHEQSVKMSQNALKKTISAIFHEDFIKTKTIIIMIYIKN